MSDDLWRLPAMTPDNEATLRPYIDAVDAYVRELAAEVLAARCPLCHGTTGPGGSCGHPLDRGRTEDDVHIVTDLDQDRARDH